MIVLGRGLICNAWFYIGAGENPVQIIYNNSDSEQGKAAGQPLIV